MTVREYLSRAYRLEQRITLLKEEIDTLRELASSVGSPGFEEHYNASKNIDAPYIKTLLKIDEYEREYMEKLESLLVTKKEIMEAIGTVENQDEQIVLTYRYIKNYTWSQIGDVLHADERTIRRWHDRAINKISCP